jgi:hypothetical protein
MGDVDGDVDDDGRTCIGAAVFDDSLSLSSLGAEQKCGSSTFTGITGDIYLIPIAISGSALTYIRALRPHCRAFNGQFIFNEGVLERNSTAEASTSGDKMAFGLRVSPSVYAFSTNVNRIR